MMIGHLMEVAKFETSPVFSPSLTHWGTTMAANRADGFAGAIGRIWSRGGPLGCEYILSNNLTLFAGNLESLRVYLRIMDGPSVLLFLELDAGLIRTPTNIFNSQSTKDLFHGPGLKPQLRAPSSFSSPPKRNTMLVALAPLPSLPVLLVV